MDGEIDYTKRTEAELLEMFGRLDPRFAPDECARLGKLLAERGYIVTQGDTGPGSVQPSARKLQELIGSSHPYEFNVEFGRSTTPMSLLEPTRNDLGFVGSGTLRADGICVYLFGQLGPGRGVPSRSHAQLQIPTRRITNVELQGRLVRFEYDSDELDHGPITLQLENDSAAATLITVLPKTRTKSFRPQLKTTLEFEAGLITKLQRPLGTYGLVAINALVFIASLFAGADLFRQTGATQIEWGSNFGPYTTDGEWWRLFTSLFIHFGLPHVLLNMVALAWFGPLVERLYGSAMYLLIYIVAGVLGSMASIGWHPAVNSAGASGAIFGICGALLAQLVLRYDLPSDISRSVRRSTLAFIGWALYASLRHKGIDYAAHLGGLGSGFILGLAATLPVRGEQSSRRQTTFRGLLIAPIAVSLLIGGVYWVKGSAASLAGDALYYRKIHWMGTQEHAVNAELNSAVKRARQDPSTLVMTLEKTVLPFWREASNRLAEIQLPSNSQNRAKLNALQDISVRRAAAFQLLDHGLRLNDPKAVTAAGKELKQIDDLAKSNPNPATISNDYQSAKPHPTE